MARHAYIDGNNNTYELGDELVYTPVTPAQSSSGMYSGGAPRRVPLDADVRAELLEMLDRIAADRANLLETRPKGAGTVIHGDHRVVARASSPLIRELEHRLRALLAN